MVDSTIRGYPESDDERESDETPHVRDGDADSAEKQHFLEVCPLPRVEAMHIHSITEKHQSCLGDWFEIPSRTNPRDLWSCSRQKLVMALSLLSQPVSTAIFPSKARA